MPRRVTTISTIASATQVLKKAISRGLRLSNSSRAAIAIAENDSNAPIIQSTALNNSLPLSRVAAAVVSISDGVKGQDQMRSESQIASREPTLMADVSTG